MGNRQLLDALLDKSAVAQVLGGILKDNSLMLTDQYKLDPSDFHNKFATICYSAIKNLSTQGMENITPMEVDIYLKDFPNQYETFSGKDGVNKQNGIEFLQKCMDFCDVSNFKYHYETVRKYSLLRSYSMEGVDVTPVLDPLSTNRGQLEKQVEKFNKSTMGEIMDFFDNRISLVKEKFSHADENQGIHASQDIKDLYESLKLEPEVGLGLHGGLLNSVVRGARLKKFFLRSGSSGSGKTRMAVADACSLGIGVYYSIFEKKWISMNEPQGTLFITTELECEEIQTMALAFVAGVDEDHILNGKCSPEEEDRVNIAIELIQRGKLDIVPLTNFDLVDVENKIRQYKYRRGTKYLFFDYIHVSLKLLAQISGQVKGMAMREDSVLYMFSVMLKDLCNELNIFIFSSTQLNRSYETKEELNETSLRGAMSLADKLDAGMIAVKPTREELELVSSIATDSFLVPNHVMHFFKVRRSKYAHLKLWSHIDLGTCQIKNLFVTDYDYQLIDIEQTEIRTPNAHDEFFAGKRMLEQVESALIEEEENTQKEMEVDILKI